MSSAENHALQADWMMHDESKAKESGGSLTAWPMPCSVMRVASHWLQSCKIAT